MSDFSDLRARGLSGLAMAVVGLGAIWWGGLVFGALALGLAALMGWELTRMMDRDGPDGRAQAAGLVAAVLVGVFSYWQAGWVALGGLALGAAVMAARMPKDRVIYGLYFALILCAGHALILRQGAFRGWVFVLWLVCVVIGLGRGGLVSPGGWIGGPKFWPRVSPKKTWSGTVAGWLLAALVGAGFALWAGMPWALVPLSALLAFAGQMGDIAESAIKRRMGVKDSSHLIPGHGGVLDRFDAMIAVAALALILAYLGAFAGIGG